MIETRPNLHRSWYDYNWDWALISLLALVFFRHHHSPISVMQPAGQDPETRLNVRNGYSTALFTDECQSFLENVIAGLGSIGA
jgi:hypothetical protein